MGTAVGTQIYFGTAVETTFGTPVTVNRFYEVLSESLERTQTTIESNGLRGGTQSGFRLGSKRKINVRGGAGNINFEVGTIGFGRWFENILGGTPTITQQGTTTAYRQVHSTGSLLGKSQTIQKQLRDDSGTVISPFTFHGCKVASAEFSISVDQLLQLTVTIDAEDVDTSTAAAVASYGNVKTFTYQGGTLKLDGTDVAKVTDATVGIDNSLRTDAYYLGGNGLKAEQNPNDFRAITGSLTAEFDSLATFYNRFANNTATELRLEFVGDTIEGAYKEECFLIVPQIRLEGDTPTVDGPGVVIQEAPFVGLYDGTNPAMTIEYQSTDTAV